MQLLCAARSLNTLSVAGCLLACSSSGSLKLRNLQRKRLEVLAVVGCARFARRFVRQDHPVPAMAVELDQEREVSGFVLPRLGINFLKHLVYYKANDKLYQ